MGLFLSLIAEQAMPSAKPKPSTADLLLKLHGDPVLFVQSVLGAEPQAWQREALEAVRDTPRVACKSGHGVVNLLC